MHMTQRGFGPDPPRLTPGDKIIQLLRAPNCSALNLPLEEHFAATPHLAKIHSEDVVGMNSPWLEADGSAHIQTL